MLRTGLQMAFYSTCIFVSLAICCNVGRLGCSKPEAVSFADEGISATPAASPPPKVSIVVHEPPDRLPGIYSLSDINTCELTLRNGGACEFVRGACSGDVLSTPGRWKLSPDGNEVAFEWNKEKAEWVRGGRNIKPASSAASNWSPWRWTSTALKVVHLKSGYLLVRDLEESAQIVDRFHSRGVDELLKPPFESTWAFFTPTALRREVEAARAADVRSTVEIVPAK